MIAHAAEAGEDRGRVVVRLGETAMPSEAALAAAAHVARAYRSEIEALFIEHPDLAAAATHDRVRAVSHHGTNRPVQKSGLADGLTHFAAASARKIARHARAAGVAFSTRIVSSEPIPALSSACAKSGPWNIVAFAEPIATPDRAALLNDALTQVWGTTAFIAAGRAAAWRNGPILAVVEDIERLAGIVRAAERIAAPAGETVLVLLAASDEIGQDWLEGEMALVLQPSPSLKILPRLPFHGPAAILSEVERLRPRLVLARYGGQAIPADATHKTLSSLTCPAIMVH